MKNLKFHASAPEKSRRCGQPSATVLDRPERTIVYNREQNRQHNPSTTCGQTCHSHTHAGSTLLTGGWPKPTTAPQPQVYKVADVTSFPKLRPISEEALGFSGRKLTVRNFCSVKEQGGGVGNLVLCCSLVPPAEIHCYLGASCGDKPQDPRALKGGVAAALLKCSQQRAQHALAIYTCGSNFSGSFLWGNVSV